MGDRAPGAQRRLPEARLKTACDRSGKRLRPRAHAMLAATWESGRVGARMGERASAAQGEGARVWGREAGRTCVGAAGCKSVLAPGAERSGAGRSEDLLY